MSNQPLITVIGATGAQGGGLARALLDDPERRFRVRAVTRRPDSIPARQLAERGAEVVQADLDDGASLGPAFEGAFGAFCVTNYWEHLSPEREQTQARAMAAAAKRHGVEHVIWSTLEDTRRFVSLADARMPTLLGRYKVPHFDAKGEIDAEFLELGLPTTFLLASFYWENLIHFGMQPRPDGNGGWVLSLPLDGAKLPGVAVEDIGRSAFAVFCRSRDYIGKTVGVAGEHLSGDEMAGILSQALRRPIRFQDMSPVHYRSLGFPGAEDLGNMFQFQRDFADAFGQARAVEPLRQLNPRLLDFSAWARTHGDQIPLT